ncbi:lysine--tRNA ligase [Arthrobacter sp. MYb224]|uniref:lysine--tRNA ligase n=1 Tax=Micrococcaceae TaxID=1268 RepID=UPI000CFC15AD|nr:MULTISPECIES: lysine--tRNA ligase [unclassified Arthrobacter]PQZ98943.1 lysine--tRNA ligase [Arthrobacter sp. MYb224]PRA03288.1 lysine--tRNA ligase [Arthrobacter sp. MYb229]PRB49759.1 lysine--tRNA ligase [Arthrobacter sp. MYb216]
MTSQNNSADSTDPNDQRQVRIDKRNALLANGEEAFPVGVARTHSLQQVREQFPELEPDQATGVKVGIAGRIVFMRNTGKLCFATVQEGGPKGAGTRLQVMLSLANVGEERLAQWKSLVDLGDHVFVTGEVISSRRGELSVMADGFEMASKALRPLPVLHADLNEETRVRQRYADLIVRNEAREMVYKRAAIIRAVRSTLEDHEYVEVETPMLQLVHGGASARPFKTHLNAFDQEMTMRIALELYLKRAVVGGVDRVFEIGRIFRNEGVDSTHSPEFTMLECYEAYADQYVMAERMQQMILNAADAIGAGRTIETANGTINLDGEWRWLSVYPGLSEAVGVEITPETDAEVLRGVAEKHQVKIDPSWSAQKLVIELFGEIVEPKLIDPTFVCDYPPLAQPLARPHRSKPGVIEAWDLIIGGMERGTAFSELIDPVIQRERLTEQSLLAAGGDPEAMQLDEDFLRALEYGAPPMGGIGLGIDRLVMLFTDLGIRETILFPLLKPEA